MAKRVITFGGNQDCDNPFFRYTVKRGGPTGSQSFLEQIAMNELFVDKHTRVVTLRLADGVLVGEAFRQASNNVRFPLQDTVVVLDAMNYRRGRRVDIVLTDDVALGELLAFRRRSTSVKLQFAESMTLNQTFDTDVYTGEENRCSIYNSRVLWEGGHLPDPVWVCQVYYALGDANSRSIRLEFTEAITAAENFVPIVESPERFVQLDDVVNIGEMFSFRGADRRFASMSDTQSIGEMFTVTGRSSGRISYVQSQELRELLNYIKGKKVTLGLTEPMTLSESYVIRGQNLSARQNQTEVTQLGELFSYARKPGAPTTKLIDSVSAYETFYFKKNARRNMTLSPEAVGTGELFNTLKTETLRVPLIDTSQIMESFSIRRSDQRIDSVQDTVQLSESFGFSRLNFENNQCSIYVSRVKWEGGFIPSPEVYCFITYTLGDGTTVRKLTFTEAVVLNESMLNYFSSLVRHQLYLVDGIQIQAIMYGPRVERELKMGAAEDIQVWEVFQTRRNKRINLALYDSMQVDEHHTVLREGGKTVILSFVESLFATEGAFVERRGRTVTLTFDEALDLNNSEMTII